MLTPSLVRFAPSPTGYLHAGNVRTALVNFLFARAAGGRFLLRIDDTDAARSKPEFEDALQEDLAWLGLSWDDCVRQSERFARYAAAVETLKSAGRLYACYETAEELDIQRKMLAGRGLPPIYNRAALSLTQEKIRQYEAEGRTPHWRFLLTEEEARWDDLIRGPSMVKATHMSDPVLIRADGVPVYTLASVVDDGELGVTHVIRGEDHVSNTGVQMQLFAALGFAAPEFAHMALLKTREGELSKRVGGNDIRALRERGILPMAINGYLAKIGTSDPIEAVTEMEALMHDFSFAKFARAPAQYDALELEKLNEKLLRQLPFSAVMGALSFKDEDFWLAIRSNIKTLNEATQWWEMINGFSSHPTKDTEYLHTASALLPHEPWDEHTWGQWTKALSAATGRKGKELFMPLRLALTGQEHGPEMKILLQIMRRDKVLLRLKASSS